MNKNYIIRKSNISLVGFFIYNLFRIGNIGVILLDFGFLFFLLLREVLGDSLSLLLLGELGIMNSLFRLESALFFTVCHSVQNNANSLIDKENNHGKKDADEEPKGTSEKIYKITYTGDLCAVIYSQNIVGIDITKHRCVSGVLVVGRVGVTLCIE